ncbi:hypothetical protein C4K88_14135 [Arthrobacter pityocampae]|uniref:Uncharacterized protein n=1 Tax=Arthrobacter pityocampae TaxID=547334 RepID=A0A2S5IU97_9MICC|nr:hypothetical protein C4K88_14135 [Arthrobacter pityocampae]
MPCCNADLIEFGLLEERIEARGPGSRTATPARPATAGSIRPTTRPFRSALPRASPVGDARSRGGCAVGLGHLDHDLVVLAGEDATDTAHRHEFRGHDEGTRPVQRRGLRLQLLEGGTLKMK